MKRHLIMLKMIFILNFMLLVFTGNAQSLMVDSLLNLHFKKVGGKNTWKQINAYYLSQSSYTNYDFLHANDLSLQDVLKSHYRNIYYKYPENYRLEMYTDGELGGIFLVTADEAKGYNLFSGSEVIFSKEMHKAMANSRMLYTLGPTSLVLSAEGEEEIEYEGVVEIYRKDCHKLVFAVKGFEDKFNVYFDAETYLIHASSNVDSTNKYKIYTDYRIADGIIIPYEISSYDGDKLIEKFKVLEIKINDNIDDYLFNNW